MMNRNTKKWNRFPFRIIYAVKIEFAGRRFALKFKICIFQCNSTLKKKTIFWQLSLRNEVDDIQIYSSPFLRTFIAWIFLQRPITNYPNRIETFFCAKIAPKGNLTKVLHRQKIILFFFKVRLYYKFLELLSFFLSI